ncbi:hypothetical protein IQ03_05291 [Gemmobacter caeni]|uniref:Uncharacterized protein n=1 Tax=Gemmobacter caeni TaxID=589035 RepID=A0A2T5ZZI2_9RHOB|nr:hypothetical protein [Gemmobacter caeni]PTX36967.1 hypothetical protein C8N34_1553 [Gemmobacter caeni]TWI87736.1 hypothetical protein IQ03_05291 [Gemmobacter caeni]
MSDLEIAVFPKEDAGEFRTILKEQDIKYSERMFFRDSVDSGGVTLLGEFTMMANTLGPAVIGAIGGWVAARQGRKVRVKMGDIEAEAGSVEQVKELLALVHQQSASEAKGDDDEGSGSAQ